MVKDNRMLRFRYHLRATSRYKYDVDIYDFRNSNSTTILEILAEHLSKSVEFNLCMCDRKATSLDGDVYNLLCLMNVETECVY